MVGPFAAYRGRGRGGEEAMGCKERGLGVFRGKNNQKYEGVKGMAAWAV